MTIPQRLSIVTLGVADLAASTAFYRSLGWEPSGSSEATITFFQMEGSVFALYEHGALAADAELDPGPFASDRAGFRGATLALNVDSVAAVDAVFAEWVAAGATPRVEPHTAEWGGHSSYVADPDGHLWEIAHNPYASFDERGCLVLAPPTD